MDARTLSLKFLCKSTWVAESSALRPFLRYKLWARQSDRRAEYLPKSGGTTIVFPAIQYPTRTISIIFCAEFANNNLWRSLWKNAPSIPSEKWQQFFNWTSVILRLLPTALHFHKYFLLFLSICIFKLKKKKKRNTYCWFRSKSRRQARDLFLSARRGNLFIYFFMLLFRSSAVDTFINAWMQYKFAYRLCLAAPICKFAYCAWLFMRFKN